MNCFNSSPVKWEATFSTIVPLSISLTCVFRSSVERISLSTTSWNWVMDGSRRRIWIVATDW